MKIWIMTASLGVHVVQAQWIKYPTAGVPKKPDGSPNLAAPAPPTRDRKPDLSGIWAPVRQRPLERGLGGSVERRRTFWDFGSVVPGGLPYKPWAAELRNKLFADRNKDNPDLNCMPLGNLQMSSVGVRRS